MTAPRRYATTDITCLACAHIDLQGDKEAAKRAFGKCGAQTTPHYVSVIAARNCLPFDPADEGKVRAREAWFAKIPMFWQIKPRQDAE